MQLGVDTELGKERIRAQTQVINRIAKASQATSVYEIPTKTSRVDGLIHVGDRLYVVEIKTRNSKITFCENGLQIYDRVGSPDNYNYVERNAYMISDSKIAQGQQVAELLSAQFFVFVYALHSDNIAYINATKLRANYDYETRLITTTQPYTQGQETDLMAMLPLNKMKILKEKK
tara:strand:+ start:1157 stop:1681 length:525 start_codon:yes stop_codon:yes gene_type:complete